MATRPLHPPIHPVMSVPVCLCMSTPDCPFVTFLIGLTVRVLPYMTPQIGSSWQRHSSHSQANKPFINTRYLAYSVHWIHRLPVLTGELWGIHFVVFDNFRPCSEWWEPRNSQCRPRTCLPPTRLSRGPIIHTSNKQCPGGVGTGGLWRAVFRRLACARIRIELCLVKTIRSKRPGEQQHITSPAHQHCGDHHYVIWRDPTLRPQIYDLSIHSRRDPMRGRSLLSPSLSAVQASVCLL